MSKLACRRSRGPFARRVALAVSLVAVLVVMIALYLSRRALHERWHMWRLERGPMTVRIESMRWLGETGDVATAERILDRLSILDALPGADDGESEVSETIAAYCQALRAVVLRERQRIVSLLESHLTVKPDRPDQENQARIGAANYLKLLGADARRAFPALERALSDPDERFSRYVREAIKSIRDAERKG